MRPLHILRFSALLAAALTPFVSFLLVDSKYFGIDTVVSVWIVLTVLVIILKLISDALAAAKQKITSAKPEENPPTFIEEVTALAFIGDYFLFAIGLLPAVAVYFVLMVIQFKYVANGFLLLALLILSALWLRWLEKSGLATIRLPLIPIKLYHVVLVCIPLSVIGIVRDLFFS